MEQSKEAKVKEVITPGPEEFKQKVLSQGFVRRTVVLHPIMDYYVKKLWAMLLEAGYEPSYSSVVNFMILEHVLSVGNTGIDPETREVILSFLEDQDTLRSIEFEEFLEKYKHMLERAWRSRI